MDTPRTIYWHLPLSVLSAIVGDVAPEASFLQESGRVLVEGLLLLPIRRDCACMNVLL